jgi:hypothetical protein
LPAFTIGAAAAFHECSRAAARRAALVKEGEVEIEIVRFRDDRSEELLARIGPGRYFVELVPMFGIRRSATAQATQPLVRRRHHGGRVSPPLPR